MHLAQKPSIQETSNKQMDKPDSEIRVLASNLKGTIAKVLKQGEEYRVRYTATSWSIQSETAVTLKPGDEVKVIGRKGNVLLIEPFQETDL